MLIPVPLHGAQSGQQFRQMLATFFFDGNELQAKSFRPHGATHRPASARIEPSCTKKCKLAVWPFGRVSLIPETYRLALTVCERAPHPLVGHTANKPRRVRRSVSTRVVNLRLGVKAPIKISSFLARV